MNIHGKSTFASTVFFACVACSAAGALGCDLDGGMPADALEVTGDAELEEAVLGQPIEPTPREEYVGPQDRIGDLAAESDPQAFTFLPPHSEETPGASQCPADQVVTGFECTGSYCDNVSIECHDYGTNVASFGQWSMWFEHEHGAIPGGPGTVKSSHVCPSGTKITGIDCWGNYCDNISIECTSAPGLGNSRCQWTGWFSEENPGPFLAASGDAIQGIWCSGTHCDNKRFLVCET